MDFNDDDFLDFFGERDYDEFDEIEEICKEYSDGDLYDGD